MKETADSLKKITDDHGDWIGRRIRAKLQTLLGTGLERTYHTVHFGMTLPYPTLRNHQRPFFSQELGSSLMSCFFQTLVAIDSNTKEGSSLYLRHNSHDVVEI